MSEQNELSAERYLELRSRYKISSIISLVATLIILVVLIIYLVNKPITNNGLSGSKLFFLFLSVVALCISMGLHLHYLILLSDPLSDLSQEIQIYEIGKIKTLAERISKNRKILYGNNVFFWLALVCLLICLFICLFNSSHNPV